MQDITKQQVNKSFGWKEFALNFLIASIPATILIVLLKQLAGIVGVLPTLVAYLGGIWLVGKVREDKGKRATWKSILIWVAINIVFFMFVPVILLEFL